MSDVSKRSISKHVVSRGRYNDFSKSCLRLCLLASRVCWWVETDRDREGHERFGGHNFVPRFCAKCVLLQSCNANRSWHTILAQHVGQQLFESLSNSALLNPLADTQGSSVGLDLLISTGICTAIVAPESELLLMIAGAICCSVIAPRRHTSRILNSEDPSATLNVKTQTSLPPGQGAFRRKNNFRPGYTPTGRDTNFVVNLPVVPNKSL